MRAEDGQPPAHSCCRHQRRFCPTSSFALGDKSHYFPRRNAAFGAPPLPQSWPRRTRDAPLESRGEVLTYLRAHVSRLALQTSAPGRALGRQVWVRNAQQAKAGGRGRGGGRGQHSGPPDRWGSLQGPTEARPLEPAHLPGAEPENRAATVQSGPPDSEQGSGQWQWAQEPQSSVRSWPLWDESDCGAS